MAQFSGLIFNTELWIHKYWTHDWYLIWKVNNDRFLMRWWLNHLQLICLLFMYLSATIFTYLDKGNHMTKLEKGEDLFKSGSYFSCLCTGTVPNNSVLSPAMNPLWLVIYIFRMEALKGSSILHTMWSPLSSMKNWPEPAQKPYGVWLDCLVIPDTASLGDPTAH